MSFVSVMFTGGNSALGVTPRLSFAPGQGGGRLVLVQQLMDDITTSHVNFLDSVTSSFDSTVIATGYVNQLNSSDWTKRLFLAIVEIDD